MDGSGRARWLALVIALALVAPACGQKPGVAESGGGSFAGGLAGSLTEDGLVLEDGTIIDPNTGEVIGSVDDTGLSDTGSTGTSSSTSGSSNTESGDNPSGDNGGDDTATESEPSGGDATGVTEDTIRIGSHAPLTGAAPVPSDSALKGSKLYWEWLKRRGVKINGRNVEAILKNDNYNPSQAVSVCKEMVEKDKVFLLSGVAGTDQIQACARYAASVGIPYLSAGVTEIGLSNLRTYFATSMTYPQQGPLLADFLVKTLGARDESTALVYFNTQNFYDGRDTFLAAMERHGIEVYVRAVSKTAGAPEAQAVATDLAQRQIDNVYVLTSPVWFLQLLQATRSQNYAPQWVGVGITMTFDTVASVGCRNGTLDGAKFFSPFPAWAESNKFDPDFRKAVREINPEEGEGDDFMWLGWMASRQLAEMLKLPGPTLTRERFIYTLERAKNITTGISPPVSFSPTDHFGADTTHVSEAKCQQDQRWHTIRTFVKSF
ncbi:MAG TPA: ABC transporter substrate-binding protein [Actinomycetota bacterium]|nr:ABC transporter substrate-binding protein [Actinomycetota bacterium]